MKRMLVGESSEAKFKELQSNVMEHLGLVQAETQLAGAYTHSHLSST